MDGFIRGFKWERIKFGIRNDGSEIKRPFSRFQIPRTIRFLPRVKVVTHDWRRAPTTSDTLVAVTVPTWLWHSRNNPHQPQKWNLQKCRKPQSFCGREPLWSVSGLHWLHLYQRKIVWKAVNKMEKVLRIERDSETLRVASEVLSGISKVLRLKILRILSARFWLIQSFENEKWFCHRDRKM